jgi:hypothetical protein
MDLRPHPAHSDGYGRLRDRPAQRADLSNAGAGQVSSPVDKARSWNCPSADQLSVLCFPYRRTDNPPSIFVPNSDTDARTEYGQAAAGVEIIMWRSGLTTGRIPGLGRLGPT